MFLPEIFKFNLLHVFTMLAILEEKLEEPSFPLLGYKNNSLWILNDICVAVHLLLLAALDWNKTNWN